MCVSSEVFIEMRGLEKSFGDLRVLKGVDLKVYRGETLVLLGGSGSGKSVLMKHMNALMQGEAGEVWVDGEDISGWDERALGGVRRKIGMMFQGGALFDSMTVGENVAFPLREGGEKDEEVIRERVAEVLTTVKLEGEEKKMPAELSGGMVKRVALARAVVGRPLGVLYDEPHAGLDPSTAASIDQLILDLSKDYGITNVVVTHEIRSVFRIADRIVYLQDGSIYWEGTGDELKASRDEVLSRFVEGRAED